MREVATLGCRANIPEHYSVVRAGPQDAAGIARIHNQGIEDRLATLETRYRTEEEVRSWLQNRPERYRVLVAKDSAGHVCGWASLNVFNPRPCYSGVADISVYVERSRRGRGLGRILLESLLEAAREGNFHKVVLAMFPHNEAARRLYRGLGFREVGTYLNQGVLDGRWVDVLVMERLLPPEGGTGTTHSTKE